MPQAEKSSTSRYVGRKAVFSELIEKIAGLEWFNREDIGKILHRDLQYARSQGSSVNIISNRQNVLNVGEALAAFEEGQNVAPLTYLLNRETITEGNEQVVYRTAVDSFIAASTLSDTEYRETISFLDEQKLWYPYAEKVRAAVEFMHKKSGGNYWEVAQAATRFAQLREMEQHPLEVHNLLQLEKFNRRGVESFTDIRSLVVTDQVIIAKGIMVNQGTQKDQYAAWAEITTRALETQNTNRVHLLDHLLTSCKFLKFMGMENQLKIHKEAVLKLLNHPFFPEYDNGPLVMMYESGNSYLHHKLGVCESEIAQATNAQDADRVKGWETNRDFVRLEQLGLQCNELQLAALQDPQLKPDAEAFKKVFTEELDAALARLDD